MKVIAKEKSDLVGLEERSVKAKAGCRIIQKLLNIVGDFGIKDHNTPTRIFILWNCLECLAESSVIMWCTLLKRIERMSKDRREKRESCKGN